MLHYNSRLLSMIILFTKIVETLKRKRGIYSNNKNGHIQE